MSEITLETTADKYLISIDRTLMDKPTFGAFFERLRLEVLTNNMNADERDLVSQRRLGILQDKGSVVFAENFKMTEEEFLGS